MHDESQHNFYTNVRVQRTTQQTINNKEAFSNAMDNDAFKKLVRERAKEKSTKEIAREAVEDEFKLKKKRRRDGDSSSDEQSDSKDLKRRDDTGLTDARRKQNSLEEEAVSKYRDRARERREGSNQDYKQSENLLQGVASAAGDEGAALGASALSKYLGGDEDHTHLVKGLDVVLARKVKREMKGAKPGPEREHPRMGHPEASKFMEKGPQARDSLQRLTADASKSEIGYELKEYILQVGQHKGEAEKQCSTAGITIQHSTLAFSIDGPFDLARAWEVPRESHGIPRNDADQTETRATPLDNLLLERVESVLGANTKDNSKAETNETTVETEPTQSSPNESDDDIFGDTGDGDYVPPAFQVESRANDGTQRISKGSIFAGLTQTKSLDSEKKPAIQDFVATLCSRLKQGQDVSKHSYRLGIDSGEYDDDMDADFDGTLEDNEGDKKRKKKRGVSGAETTTAAKEYGAAISRSIV
jgi:hypothetical protein